MRFIVGLLSLLLLLGCDRSQPAIKLGVVLPLTGEFQIYGQQGLNGARLAVDEINRAGGVLGRPLELIVQDNQTNPSEAARLSRELIQLDDVFALLGPVSSVARNAVLEVAERYKVPLFYGIDYEGGSYSRYLFCYSAIPDHYVKPLVPYLMDTSGSRFYVFGYDYVWPHEIARSIDRSVTAHGGVVEGIEFTPFGAKDYTATLQRLKASGADNLMLILPGPDGFDFLQQFSQFDFERPVKVMAFAADENYLTAVPAEQLEGVITALHFFNSLDSSVAQAFVQRYQQALAGRSVATYSSKAHYDLIYLLKHALETAGTVDREALIDAISGQTLYSGADQITLRSDHHVDLPMYLAEYQQGQLNIIEKLGVISPQDQRRVGWVQ